MASVTAFNVQRRAAYAALSKDARDVLLKKNRARWADNKDVYKIAGDAWRAEHRDELRADERRRGAEYRAFIDLMKAGKSCLDCGNAYPMFCMEYDHVRGTKRWALGKMANHSRDAVLEEIAKCDLVCCACHRVRTQERRGSSRTPRVIEFREWLNVLKSRPCLDCGLIRPPVAMDFDHVRGEKVRQITDMWSWSRDKVLVEIAKCDLVCCICHRVRTQARRPQQEAA